MAGKDHYYNKAKQEGYRSRAAYKLKQLDQLENVIDRGDTVVDLGAAPGGWLEVAAEAVGSEGNVIGVDFQRIKDFEDHDNVETLRGDMTEDKTRDRVIDAAGARSTSSSPTWRPTCPGSTRSIRPARCTSHDRPSRRPSNSSTAAGTSS